jgi:hypothetical protein
MQLYPLTNTDFCRVLVNNGPYAVPSEGDSELLARHARRQALWDAGPSNMDQADMDWWVAAFPKDWDLYFEEYHNGLWWLRTQELVGKLFTIGGIILYSDKTVVLRGVQCYPVYSECICLKNGFVQNCLHVMVFACC